MAYFLKIGSTETIVLTLETIVKSVKTIVKTIETIVETLQNYSETIILHQKMATFYHFFGKQLA